MARKTAADVHLELSVHQKESEERWKTVFNKFQGYNEVNGQRIPLTEVELEQAIINSALFSSE